MRTEAGKAQMLRPTRGAGRSQILVYELNEVPWLVIDRYLSKRPGSRLGRVLERAASYTTVCDDDRPLEPWRSWPVFHTGLRTSEHGSMDLGQDPATFRGEPFWDTAARHGRSVGVFGALQSWPAHRFDQGGFYVPDTFARSSDCVPASLEPFQALNLRLTRDNTFSADAPVEAGTMARAPATMLRAGVRVRSGVAIAKHLVAERLDARRRAGRSIMQAQPMFDVFEQLMARYDPDLGVFFTNHVAGMMHRFWADAMAEFGDDTPYPPDAAHRTLIWKAMDVFDRHVARLERWCDRAPDRLVVVASSMGQRPIPYVSDHPCTVLDDPQRLLSVLGWPDATAGLAMYPGYAFAFRTSDEAVLAAAALGGITVDDEPLFRNLRTTGTTVHADICSHRSTTDRSIATLDGTERSVGLDSLGVVVRRRLGGTNTAHHVPEGSMFVFGDGIQASADRAVVDARHVRPFLLDQLGVEPALAA